MKLIRLWKLIKKMNLLDKQDKQGLINKNIIETERITVMRYIYFELSRLRRIKVIMNYSPVKDRIVWKIKFKKKEIEIK